MQNMTFTGIDSDALAHVRTTGVERGGNAVEPYIDGEGGKPMRCCLADSAAGDQIALIAWSPFSWKGPYAETGPIFVHGNECTGPPPSSELPHELDTRAMVLRPYTNDHRISYADVRHAPADGSLVEEIAAMLAIEGIDFVHGRNVAGGCYAFEARLVD